MTAADPTDHRLDQLATLVAALQDEVARLALELDALRRQAQQVTPPCRACGERILGYRPPAARADRDRLARLGLDPETGHRIRCGAVLTERAQLEARAAL